MSEQGGAGVLMQIKIGGNFVALVHMQKVAFPEQEKTLWESTAHDDVEDGKVWKRFLDTGLRSLNEFTATLVWDPKETSHAAIQAGFDSLDPVSVHMEAPNGNEAVEFDMHIKKLGRVTEMDQGFQCEVACQPTGGWTLTVT
jgi:hypothetical protein